jgi:transcriptional regulator with XRE-family HTH domain
MSYAEKIYKHMVVKGLNQKALARLAGVSDSEVSRILRGQSSPSLEYAARLARALGLSLDDLTDGGTQGSARATRDEVGLEGELAALVKELGPRQARRLLETAADLGYDVAIRRLLGVEMKPVIEPAVGVSNGQPRAKQSGEAHRGASGRANSA